VTITQTLAADTRPAKDSEGLRSRIVRCYTRSSWTIADLLAGDLPPESPPLDALIATSEALEGPHGLEKAADRLKPLGRLILEAPEAHRTALEAVLESDECSMSIIARFHAGSGRSVLVAERTPEDLNFSAPLRADAHLGYYKMSRYRTYRAMQAAVAQLVEPPRDVIEIGDSNGVMRDMLGHESARYFRASYPPHDLTRLDGIPDDAFDAFLCDNTLEHVDDPAAALRQMHRVLRPGGWLILMSPFIAMAQDDDRARWSPLALKEMLAAHFAEGVAGSWGNVEAACAYIRDNKWLRVHRARAGVLSCRDSRRADAPELRLPDSDDRHHPIHVWALARKVDTARPDLAWTIGPPPAEPLKRACRALSAQLRRTSQVLVLPARDGAALDELARTGHAPVGVEPSLLHANFCLNRGYEAAPHPPIQPLHAALVDGTKPEAARWISLAAQNTRPGAVLAIAHAAADRDARASLERDALAAGLVPLRSDEHALLFAQAGPAA
jgi:SAM-dependent methyltransferase